MLRLVNKVVSIPWTVDTSTSRGDGVDSPVASLRSRVGSKRQKEGVLKSQGTQISLRTSND